MHRCLHECDTPLRWIGAVLAALLLVNVAENVRADDEPRPIASYIPLKSPLDATSAGFVQNTALEMEEKARLEDRPAVLVLEIPPGTSEMPQVLSLANFLVSPKIARVRTVAWVPKTVTGNNVVLALACREIVMQPDAKLGDIGRGEALRPFEERSVLDIVENRHNPKLSTALVRGMCDPALKVLRVNVTTGEPPDESTKSHVLIADEFEEFTRGIEGAVKSKVLSEAGDPLVVSGLQARDADVLAVATAEDRTGIETLYNTPLLVPKRDADEPTKVRLVKVDGRIDPVMGQFIQRQIQRAAGSGVNTIIFEIDSPGGVLQDSWSLAQAIAALGDRDEPVRTIAYVPNGRFEGALGGAAIVALGCDEIYMQESALIGDIGRAALEVEGDDENRQMLVDNLNEWVRDLADQKGRPAAVALAMVSSGTEIVRVRHVDDQRISYLTREEFAVSNEWQLDGANPVVPESLEPTPMQLDGLRATELQIAGPPVTDLADLKVRVGVPADQDLVAARRNWVDDVVFALNTEAALYILLVGGFVLMFLEAHLMTGIFAFASILCFVLLFWSRVLGGTAGYLEVILFAAGFLCLVIEAFVMPGFGVFGITGGVMIFAAIVMASQTFGNLEPNEDLRRLSATITTMGASVFSVIVIGLLASRFLPHLPVFKHMVLQPPGHTEDDGPQLKRELTNSFEGVVAGDQGTTSTTLRPAGKATVKGRYLDVVSDGPFIQAGEPIEVVSVSGNRVVVKQITA